MGSRATDPRDHLKLIGNGTTRGNASPKASDGAEPRKDGADTDAALEQLSARWRQVHRLHAQKISRRLLKERPQVTADERVVLDLAAHDAALAQVLADVQVELANRVRVLLDNVVVAVSLAKALREVTKVRDAAAKRVEESFVAAGTLRNQRQIVPPSSRLRAVS